MKKLIFAGLTVLFALSFATCDMAPIGAGAGEEIIGYTNVVYSEDGKSLTLYLEGGVPETKASRALNANNARKGHDFYEVVFVNAANGVSRASWLRGQSAAITNITRGLDYGDVDGHLTGEGSAIIFVGTNSGKTLLAVGTLTGTDTGGTVIAANTRTATFSVAALVGDVSTFAVTGGVSDTSVYGTAPNDITFNRFHLASATHAATYPISTVTGTLIADYIEGIKIARDITGPNNGAEIIPPRVLVGGGIYDYLGPIDLKPDVTLTNNNTADDSFNPNIGFSIDTNGATGGICALTFSIPVYAIDNTTTPLTGGAPVIWNIRPGYFGYEFDLDNGNGDIEGALLLSAGSGNFETLILITVGP
ncbi:MAG: hypothetical protein FWD40_05040 [Treponema sp.]|nr:hypothetical protein [Treponema sp.]